jgi:hypothetical protein
MGAPSTAFAAKFQDTITLLAQQSDDRLRNCVMVDTNWTGISKFYDQYASDSMVEIMTRLQDTPLQDPDHRRRMVSPRYFVSNTLLDPTEALQILADPKSTYMQAKKAAVARQTDALIISALGGTAYQGATGTTAVTIAAAMKITTSAAGLTLAKLTKSSRLLNAGEVDREDRYIVHAAIQLEDLLNVTTNTSVDYNTVKALVQGEIDTWVGFKFVHSEQLTLASSIRYCYAWQKKGVQLAIQQDAEGRITERPDKNYAWQTYIRIALGATRLEEARVVEIQCTDAS